MPERFDDCPRKSPSVTARLVLKSTYFLKQIYQIYQLRIGGDCYIVLNSVFRKICLTSQMIAVELMLVRLMTSM